MGQNIHQKYLEIVHESQLSGKWSQTDLAAYARMNSMREEIAKTGNTRKLMALSREMDHLYSKYGIRFPWYNN